LDNELIDGLPSAVDAGRIRRRQRLGGLRNYYCRAAWHAAGRLGRSMGHFGLGAAPLRRRSGFWTPRDRAQSRRGKGPPV